MSSEQTALFDPVAADYDREFSDTLLGRLLRNQVWRLLLQRFQPGDHILDLACGSGEDAVWLAQRGMRVSACDASSNMLAQLRHKAAHSACADAITTHQVDLSNPLLPQGPFEGVLANFGGLNVLSERRTLAQALAERVRPGGHLILVVMGPICPWEIGWHLLHLQPQRALRRLRQPATAHIGGQALPIWYPSARRLRREFAPWFHFRAVHSLGFWLPPSYLAPLAARHPQLTQLLARLDRQTAPLLRGVGDHMMVILQRQESA